MNDKSYRALLVTDKGNYVTRKVTERKISELPDHDVLINVKYSALNYKDALSATGHKGITRQFPHTPGVDAAGVVEESRSQKFSAGDEVIVTGYDLGMNTPGGFGQYIRVPAEWVVRKPSAFTLKESMVMGTAGFTAGLGLYKMQQNGQTPAMGELLVTGATGGVGSLGVGILAKAGYEVIAATGKKEEHDYLRELGASQCIHRSEVDDESGKPLMRAKWAGVLETVGGNTLATAIKACKPFGNVAACGNVSSVELHTTIFPFILNGINLLGVASADTPMEVRLKIWEKLSSEWKPGNLDKMHTLCSLDELENHIQLILQGKTKGRVVVEL